MIVLIAILLLITLAPLLLVAGALAAFGVGFVLFLLWLYALVGAISRYSYVRRAGEE